MTKKASAFKTWFVAQHGLRISNKTLSELRRIRNDKEAALIEADWALSRCKDYDNRMQSALYAWNAKGKS